MEGNVLGAGKIGGRKLQSWVSNSSTHYIPYYYSLDAEGNRTQELEKDTKPFNPKVRPWYKAAVAAGKPAWSDIYLVVPTFDPAIAASLPVYNPQNHDLIGVCGTDIFLPQQMSQFLRSLNVGKTGHIFIMERSGQLVATSADEPMTIGQGENTRRLFATQSSNSIIQTTAQQLSDRFGHFNRIQASEQFDFNINNNRQLAEVTPFKDRYGLDWLIVTVIPEADYLGQIQANIRSTLLLCVVALIAAFILCILIARWITRPVLSLNRSAKAIATGEWNQIVHIKRSDELGELANSFNLMAHQLQTAFAEMQTLNQTLAQNETRLKEFLEAIPVGIVVVDTAGRPYYFNQRATQLLGKESDPSLSPDQLAEVYQAYLAGTDQTYPTERMPLIQALSGERTTVDDMEISQNNTTVPIEVWGTPIFDEQGNVAYALAAFQDITERRQAEQLLADYNRTLEQQVAERTAALQQREAELRALFAAVPDPLFVLTAEGRVIEAVEVGADRLHKPIEEQVGKTLHEIFSQEQADEFLAYTHQVLSTQQVLTVEYSLPMAGQTTWFSTRIAPIRTNQVIWLARDITQRKQAEEALQRSEAKFRNIFENSQVGIFRTRLSDGLILDANQRLVELFGFDSPDEIIGIKRTTDFYVNPVELHPHLGELQIFDKHVRNIEVQIRKRNGTLFWGLYSFRLNTADGYMECVIADISDRKQAEAALQNSEERLRLALTATNQGLYDLDLKTEERIVNPEYALMLGYDPATFHEPISEWIARLHPDDRESVVATYRAYIAGEIPSYQAEYRQRTQDGQWKWTLSVGKIVAWDESGQPMRMLGTHADIDDRKRAEAASILEERNHMAREIHDTLAQAFTGIIIHTRSASNKVTADPEKAQTLLTQILDLARSGLAEARRSVEALHRPYLLESSNLQAALSRLAAQLDSSSATQIVYEVIGTIYPLSSDLENNLFRIGQEALTNAIKYAEAHEIRIELVYEPTQCILRIKDDGQGFDVENQAMRNGFGLLGMAQRAERIRAELKIQSHLGQGTEIVVSIDRE